MAINEITGDEIKSKSPSKEFEKNYGVIDWSVKLVLPKEKDTNEQETSKDS